jgi:hypothetical protein
VTDQVLSLFSPPFKKSRAYGWESDRLTLLRELSSAVGSNLATQLGSDGEQMICAALLCTLGFGPRARPASVEKSRGVSFLARFLAVLAPLLSFLARARARAQSRGGDRRILVPLGPSAE